MSAAEANPKGTVLHIQNAQALKSTLENAKESLVVIDFFATWCGPCQMISPAIEGLATTMTNVVFVKVDVDVCDDIAHEYDISNLPTFVLIKGGNVVEKFSGANLQKLKNAIEMHV